MDPSEKPTDDDVRRTVQEGYARIAADSPQGCCGPKACCCGASAPEALARSLGYGEGELAALPEGANMGLSCGNPTPLAALAAGDVVLDLGSGGGFDVFIAARKVGPSGRAIGVDMTPEMVRKARQHAAAFRDRTGLENVDFRLGEIEHLPVADASVDVVVSNCVINLSPDKPQVWREMFRVLKPGGRVAVSDLALLQPLPEAIRQSVAALVGCLAGAVPAEETRRMAAEAGFVEIALTSKPEAIEHMADGNAPLYRSVLDALPADHEVGDYAASMDIAARKPL
ncbi:MAG: arsenite methyltransferase [Candidatus Brocadiia bacterium]